MSWSFSVAGKSKDEAKAAVMVDPCVSQWKYMPANVAQALCAAIDGMPEPGEGRAINVETSGHLHVVDDVPQDDGGAAIQLRIYIARA